MVVARGRAGADHLGQAGGVEERVVAPVDRHLGPVGAKDVRRGGGGAGGKQVERGEA